MEYSLNRPVWGFAIYYLFVFLLASILFSASWTWILDIFPGLVEKGILPSRIEWFDAVKVGIVVSLFFMVITAPTQIVNSIIRPHAEE